MWHKVSDAPRQTVEEEQKQLCTGTHSVVACRKVVNDNFFDRVAALANPNNSEIETARHLACSGIVSQPCLRGSWHAKLTETTLMIWMHAQYQQTPDMSST